MNNQSGNEGDIALNSNEVLQNFGGDQMNNFLNLFNLDDFNNLTQTNPSLYFDTDGLIKLFNNHSKSLSILSLNAQSIRSKFAQFSTLLHELKQKGFFFDIICLQESWLTKNDDKNMLDQLGFVINFIKDT